MGNKLEKEKRPIQQRGVSGASTGRNDTRKQQTKQRPSVSTPSTYSTPSNKLSDNDTGQLHNIRVTNQGVAYHGNHVPNTFDIQRQQTHPLAGTELNQDMDSQSKTNPREFEPKMVSVGIKKFSDQDRNTTHSKLTSCDVGNGSTDANITQSEKAVPTTDTAMFVNNIMEGAKRACQDETRRRPEVPIVNSSETLGNYKMGVTESDLNVQNIHNQREIQATCDRPSLNFGEVRPVLESVIASEYRSSSSTSRNECPAGITKQGTDRNHETNDVPQVDIEKVEVNTVDIRYNKNDEVPETLTSKALKGDGTNETCGRSEPPTSQKLFTGIVTILKDHFGFIRPDEECQEITRKTVHFKKRNAPKGITENQHVYFHLSEKGTKQKPTANRVWFCLDNATNTSAGSTKNKMPTEQKPLPENGNQVKMPSKTSRRGTIIRVIPENAKLNKPAFGFIKPFESLSEEYGRDHVHFIVSQVESAGLEIIAGDTLEFVLGIKNKEKPTAFQPKLVECTPRHRVVMEKYMSHICNKLRYSDEEGFDAKDLCGLLSCMPVWRCMANTTQISANGFRVFMELIMKLEEKTKGFEGNFKFVMKEITKSSLFNPTTGELKRFILRLKVEEGDTTVPSILKHFILVILKHVPEMAQPLVRTMKPLVSQKETSVERFLYELLILSTKALGTFGEYILWDEMPLVPGTSELFQELEPKDLLIAKEIGEYSSVEEYFEVYFRLLREDCFHGLKKGVQGLLQRNLDPRDMAVFQCEGLYGMHLNEFECSLSVGIKVKPLNRKKNWFSASNLMFGNLVCITTSFQNNIWGTVISRELLQSHDIVLIQLSSSGNSMSVVDIISHLYGSKNQTILVESPTYYKAFEPVLRTLQKMTPDKIPFQEELVKVQKSLTLYVSKEKEQKDDTLRVGSIVEGTPWQHVKASDLEGLDTSQAKAVEHALSKRLAIIQGPPGTGKTFIGVKVIKLLESMNRLTKLPILVLTYKNHALDEFLKDLLMLFPKKVARIGGRSQDEILQSCNLTEIKRECRMPKNQYDMVKDYKAEIESLKDEIEAEVEHLHTSQELCLSTLMEKLSHSQIQNILLGCDWSKTSIPSLQQTDSDGFLTKRSKKSVKFKVMDRNEAVTIISNLNQSVASFLESEKSEEDKIWMHLSRMTEAALQQWIPPKSKFEEILGIFAFDISAVNFKGKSAGNYEESDDIDAEEQEKERLASCAQSKKKGKSLLEEMFFFKKVQPSKGMPQLHLNSVKLIQDAPILYYANIVNPWDLPLRDRIIFIQAMLRDTFEEKKKKMESLLARYEEVVTAKREVEDSFKVQILERMSVVGMTITGASIHNQLLSQLKPSVVIIEEAGEVLEPQILPVLGDWVKHLILIGDHKQLRPSVDSYVLAKQYHFDISMMERLINNNLDYKSLQMQNRMRVEFAELLLDIYPNLQSNTARVKKNIAPACVEKAMYFWTHSDEETAERSYKNEAEAYRAIKLALFLIQQDYRPSQITILGAYQGQVSLLRKIMKKAEDEYKSVFQRHKKFFKPLTDVEKENNALNKEDKDETVEHVQIQTVDNYQGDENDIIIVSLVRSNSRKQVGFLNTLNRRCVAQSRARCGMYFIGDKNTLVSSVHWGALIQPLQEKGCVGTHLKLKCPRHPTVSISARKAEDITLGSFCKADCSMKMSCQIHVCKKLCQPAHAHTPCFDMVEFYFENCRHLGRRLCYEKETEKLCKKQLPMTFALCGHTGFRPCFKPADDMKCQEQCTKILPCQHMCTMKCSEPCNVDTCDMCARIQKEKEEQEKRAKEQERKRIEEEVEKEINNLRDMKKELIRHELLPTGETASEYNDVEDRVKKYIQVGHKWFPLIKKIEKIENPALRLKWLEYKRKMFDPTYEELKFHGTTEEAVGAIVEKGFKMPKPSGQMYGPGIYFATDSSKSAQEMYTKGSNMLLLCKVLLGKTCTVESAQRDMTGERLKESNCDSLYARRDTRKSGGVLYDEYVVFDVRQALPKYVVHYNKVNIEDPVIQANYLETKALGSKKLVKYTVHPKREIKMDDPLDIHLRIAEAQFQRLLISQKYEGAAAQVKSVDYYINPPLVEKFQAKANDFDRKYKNTEKADYILGFHGTKPENILSIVNNNFSLSYLSQNTGNRGAYGAGIYFSEFPSVSLNYGKSLLLCKVLPGKPFDVPKGKQMSGAPLQEGFDSHRVQKDSEGRGQAVVIYDPDQILPCYVINL